MSSAEEKGLAKRRSLPSASVELKKEKVQRQLAKKEARKRKISDRKILTEAKKKRKLEEEKKEQDRLLQTIEKLDLVVLPEKEVVENEDYVLYAELKQQSRTHVSFLSIMRQVFSSQLNKLVSEETSMAMPDNKKMRKVKDSSSRRKSFDKVGEEEIFYFFIDSMLSRSALKTLERKRNIEKEKKKAKKDNIYDEILQMPPFLTEERRKHIQGYITADIAEVAECWYNSIRNVVRIPEVCALDDVLYKYTGDVKGTKMIIPNKPAREGVYSDAVAVMMENQYLPVPIYFRPFNVVGAKVANGESAALMAQKIGQDTGEQHVFVLDAGYGTWAMIDRFMMSEPAQAVVCGMNEIFFGSIGPVVDILSRKLPLGYTRSARITRTVPNSDAKYEAIVSVSLSTKDENSRKIITVSTAHKHCVQAGGHQQTLTNLVTAESVEQLAKMQGGLLVKVLAQRYNVAAGGGGSNTLGLAAKVLGVSMERVLKEKQRKQRELEAEEEKRDEDDISDDDFEDSEDDEESVDGAPHCIVGR